MIQGLIKLIDKKFNLQIMKENIIYWYSFFIVIGVVIGYFLIKRDAKKQNINLTFKQ